MNGCGSHECLVERPKGMGTNSGCNCPAWKLRALLGACYTALKPFAHKDLTEVLGGNVEGRESIVYQRNMAKLRLGDFQIARGILAKVGRVPDE